jgi:hypothetical protein
MNTKDNSTMKILVSDTRTLSSLQEEFTSRFPYLKIEFFSRSHKPGAPSSRKFMKDVNQTVGECRTMRNNGRISISSTMTVAELEQTFREKYGLNVQLFRKSGKVWLETTVTDSWTLEQQNNQGEALNNLVFSDFPRSVFPGRAK